MNDSPADGGRRSDPRPERTRAALTAALMELIQEKRWDRIRVQDVLDRTSIGRSTFYTHFDNKYDLLTAAIPGVVGNILGPDSNAAEFDLLPLFEHIEEMRPILRPILSQPILSEIVQSFHDQLKQTWIAHLVTIEIAPSEHDLVGDVLAGSLVAVITRWAKSSTPPAVDALCVQYSRYADSVIRTAARIT